MTHLDERRAHPDSLQRGDTINLVPNFSPIRLSLMNPGVSLSFMTFNESTKHYPPTLAVSTGAMYTTACDSEVSWCSFHSRLHLLPAPQRKAHPPRVASRRHPPVITPSAANR